MNSSVDHFKKQLWISTAIIVGSVILAGIALFLLASHIDSLTLKITGARQAAADESAAYGMLAGLKRDATAAAQYQIAVDKLLPSQDGVIAFSSQVNQLAVNEGVSSNVSFQGDATPPAPPLAGSINFILSATGPIDKVLAFIKDVELKAPVALSSIDTFDLSRSGGGYTISAQGKVYFK